MERNLNATLSNSASQSSEKKLKLVGQHYAAIKSVNKMISRIPIRPVQKSSADKNPNLQKNENELIKKRIAKSHQVNFYTDNRSSQ